MNLKYILIPIYPLPFHAQCFATIMVPSTLPMPVNIIIWDINHNIIKQK